MSEREDAIKLANRILDRNSADPDDVLAILARQLIRRTEAASTIFTNVAQILDVVKIEWGKAWSAWDQEQRDSISQFLMTTEQYVQYKAAAAEPRRVESELVASASGTRSTDSGTPLSAPPTLTPTETLEREIAKLTCEWCLKEFPITDGHYHKISGNPDRPYGYIENCTSKVAELLPTIEREKAKARLEEAERWEHLVGAQHHLEGREYCEPDCMYCARIAALRAAAQGERHE